MIKVNSEALAGFENMSVAQLIAERGYRKMYVAVELNGKILPKAEFDTTMLKDGDVLEVVSFVGGG